MELKKFAVTFGAQYNNKHVAHPINKHITGNHFIAVEAANEMEARQKTVELVGSHWSFMYEWEEFEPQIEKYGLEEFPVKDI